MGAQQFEAQRVEIEQLRTENGKLREAFKRIKWHLENDHEEHGTVIVSTMLANIEIIVTQALKNK